MCKLIGISGGTKKNRRAFAWILANSIEEIRKGTTKAKFDILYRCWVDLVDVDHAIVASTNHVIIDSFGDHILDQVKQFCPTLIPYDLHDDNILSRTRINPFTFEMYDVNTEPTCTAGELHAMLAEDRKDAILTLGEFIMYFAHYTMKTAFGERVWLNVAASTASAVSSDDWRIYEDCKTQAEINYIKESGGTLVMLVDDTDHLKSPSTFVECRLKEQCDQIYNFINNLYGIQEKS